MTTSRPGPLSGYRVIDVTSVVAGPYATQIIADLGADVIKVEARRRATSCAGRPGRRRTPGMAPIYLTINRNKRSVALDLKHESAKRALRRLIAGADVFVTNVRPQGMARLGFDYEDVRALRAGHRLRARRRLRLGRRVCRRSRPTTT